MRALRIEEGTLVFHENYSRPSMQSGECLVQIHSAALNRRDQWICQGAYPRIQNSTLGSDGSGVVIQGEEELLGKEVLLCPSLDWGKNPNHQSKNYTILGMPVDGTFAGYCRVPKENLVQKPLHLSHVQAAALPLAGLTAWRALCTQGGLSSNENLLITGIGGGVSTLALQIAVAKNANVWITSSSDRKIEKAIEQGAVGGANYTIPGWEKELPNNFDVILDGAGGEGFGVLVRKLAMGGRLVFYGGTTGAWPSILPQYLFFKQARIIGSTMGTIPEFRQLIDFVSLHKVVPIVETTFALNEFEQAFSTLMSPEKMGKIVFVNP